MRVGLCMESSLIRASLSILIKGLKGVDFTGCYDTPEIAVEALAAAAPEVLLVAVLEGKVEAVFPVFAAARQRTIATIALAEGEISPFDANRLLAAGTGAIVGLFYPGELFLPLLQFVSNHHLVIQQGIVSEQASSASDDRAALTERERQTLSLLAAGKPVKGIAVELGIEIKTAEAHTSNVMRKLGLHNRAELVAYHFFHSSFAAGGGQLFEALRPADGRQIHFTSREREIVAMVADLRDNSGIAAQLNITVDTVKVHLGHIFRKTHVNNRRELAEWARERLTSEAAALQA